MDVLTAPGLIISSLLPIIELLFLIKIVFVLTKKDIEYWVKGASIGTGIILFLSLAIFIYLVIDSGTEGLMYGSVYMLLFSVVPAIIAGVVGGIIGLIIKKIKSNK